MQLSIADEALHRVVCRREGFAPVRDSAITPNLCSRCLLGKQAVGVAAGENVVGV